MDKYDNMHTSIAGTKLEDRRRIQKLSTSSEGDATQAVSLKYLDEVTEIVIFCN